MQTIAIGTMSECKIAAAGRAITSAGLQARVQLIGTKTSSGVPEQPLGFEEIRQGALRRALGALENVSDAQFALGIENGLVDIGAMGPLIDLAVVVLIERSPSMLHMLSTAIYTTSTGVPCDPKYFRQSYDTVRTKTVGAFIAEEMGCDGTDWHAHLSGGYLLRSNILEQAVLGALSFRFCGPSGGSAGRSA